MIVSAGQTHIPPFRRLVVAVVSMTVAALLAVMLVPASNNAFADDNAATENLEMACTLTPALTPDSVIEAGVQGVVAGETVVFTTTVSLDAGTVYQDILTRPDGSIYRASRIEITSLPSTLAVDPTSVTFSIDGTPTAVLLQATADPAQFVVDVDTSVPGATTWRLIFPGDEAQMLADQSGFGLPSYVVPADGHELALSYEATVDPGAVRGVIQEGSECFASLSTGPSNRDTDRPRTALVTVEPELNLAKTTNLDNSYPSGSIVEFDLAASVPIVDDLTQSHSIAAAQDVTLVDDVPVGLNPVDATDTPVADGAATAAGGIWDATARTITYTFGTIDPGNFVLVTERMEIDSTNPPAAVLVNSVCATFTALGETGEPTRSAGCDDAQVVVASESPTISKRAVRIPDGSDLERYGTELPFWFDLTVTLPGNSNYENFTILDQLPDGLTFNSYVSASCTPAGPTCPTPITDLAATVFPGGNGTAIGWYPNSLPFDANPRVITLRYEAEMASVYSSGDPVTFFDEFTNQASINWNTVDRLGAVDPVTASPPTFDGNVATSDSIIYDRPLLEVDKRVTTTDGVSANASRASWDYEVGDIATYSVTIVNTGSSDAWNIAYDDAPSGIAIDLSSVLVDGNPCGTCTLGGGNLQTTLAGPLAPGQTITVSYEAIPTKNGDLDNTVELPLYEDAFATPYTETPADSVGLNIADPVLTLSKTEVSSIPETANTIGTRFPFTFKVTNVSTTTAYTPIVTDQPPAGLCTIPSGLDPAATGVTESAPGVWELDNPLSPGSSLTFMAWLEVCGPIDPGSYLNEATLTWTDLSDGVDEGGNPYTTADDAPVELIGPSFVVTKGPAVDGGASLKWSADVDDPEDGLQADELNGGVWTIVVTNTGPAPIGGLNVVDPMPAPFEYLPGSATVIWVGQTPDSFTDNSAPTGAEVWPGYTTEADFTIGQLEPGAEIRIDVPFIHTGEDPPGGVLTRLNTVEVRNDNLPFDAALHAAEGEYTLIPIEAGPVVSKTVSTPSPAPGIGTESVQGAPGQQFDFAIELTLPTKATTSLHDTWVLDVLPDGFQLVGEPATGAVPASPGTGWTVTCTANCGTGASAGGEYLGSQPGTNGATELAWWFDEVAPDAAEVDIVYVITFRAEMEPAFDDGTEIIDGFDEPLVNIVKPIFNRDTALPGSPSGNVILTTPAGVPDPDDFDRVYPQDDANVDVVTPRLDIEKKVYNAIGQEIEEVTAGESFNYEIVIANGGTGPAFDIDINDTFGTPSVWTGANFLSWDPASITATPAGVVCSVYSPSPPDPVQHLGCEFPGPLAPGDSIVVTYDATTVPNTEFYAQTSTNNFDPMIIRNEATAPEYWEAAGEGGNQYSTGQGVTRLFAYTPVPEVDATCVGGAESLPNAPVGTDVQFWAVFGNGDRVDINGNPGGDQTMTPFPTEDLDGDGFPDAGIGFNPEVRITIQDKFTYLGTTATGPGVGDPTYSTYSPFPAPDQILDEEEPNTYTLVWNSSLTDIPHSPGHAVEGSFLPHLGQPVPTNGSFLPHYALLIDVTKTEAGGATIWYELRLEDAAGNVDRGTSVGEPFTFIEKDRHGCPGGPAPRVWKYPDDTDGVTLAPGETDEFVIYVQQPNDSSVASTFTDLLPAGLQYRGDLPVTDPDYAVATMDAIPSSWPAGATLEDYFVSSTPDAAGNTSIIWNPPPLPTGVWNDPNAGGADTRFVIRIPVIALDNPPFPNEFVVNKFEWNGGGTIRTDSGAMLTESAGKPQIDKRVDTSAGLYGDVFQYTIDITIPGGYAGNDVVIYDQINRGRNWDPAPYLLQETAQSWSTGNFVFPFTVGAPAPPAPPSPEYRYAHWLYTPAEFELSDYVSQTCLAGCAGPDAIQLVPLPPADLDETLTLPLNSGDQYATEGNGAIGWYLGDVDAHTGGQDRVVRLVYEVEAPTLLDQRQRIFEQQPSNFPGGATDPGFDVRNSYWFEELSQVVHPNLVQFRQFGAQNAQLGSWEDATDTEWQSGSNAWVGELGRSSVLASADEVVTVSYPIIDMDKRCGAIGVDDPTDQTNPVPMPVGTPNVECDIVLTNRSPVDGFDIKVTDTPLADCVLAGVTYWGETSYIGNINSSNPWHVARSASGTGFVDPADPGVVTYPCEVQTLLPIPSTGLVTDNAGGFPVAWDLNIGPNASETLTYQFYLDGWTDQPYNARLINNGSWDSQGQWINNAVLAPWAAEAGGPPIGEAVVVTDQVAFEDAYLQAQKFPYPFSRDVCADAGPFVQWNQAPEAALTNLWPWRHDPAGDRYIASNAAYAAGFGNPLNSEYWTDGDNNCADPLMPPAREVVAYSHPGVLRQIPLGTYGFSGTNGWSGWGDPFANQFNGNWGEGWFNRPLNEPTVWSPQYNVTPTVPYRWAIDLRVDGLRMLSDIDITDTLPYGWEYVPGSATIIDGVWMLGNHAGGTYDADQGVTVGYGEIPIPDPARGNIGGGACHADNNYHSGGETLTWNFERSGGSDGDAPWLYQYVNSLERVASNGTVWPGYQTQTTGFSDKATWVRIHFDALPTMAVFDCDPDPTSSERFMMENNLEVTAIRTNPLAGQSIVMTDRFDALAPVANPVTFEKLPDNDFVGDDTTAFFTIEFTNQLPDPVTDLLIIDDLSANIAPLTGAGYDCGSASATLAGSAIALNETVCTGGLSQNTHLEWLIASIGPGETLEITIPIIVPKDETNTLQWNNTASTFVKEFFDSPFSDDGRITVLNPSPPPTPSKTVSPNPATVNDIVTFEVQWTADPLRVFMDLAYIDTMPDGLTFEALTGVTCSGGCPNSYSPADVISVTPVPNADGTTALMWWFGDMPGSSVAHTWTMTYTARVDDTYNDGTPLTDEDALVNTVTGYSSSENLLDPPSGLLDPSAWSASEHPPSSPGSATLDIEEPELAVSKGAVSLPDPPDGSAIITFSVTVTNTSGIDAHNITITDTPNLALENIVTTPATYPGSFVTQGWTSLVPELSWFITTLPVGESATFTYDAEVIDTFLIDGVWVAENAASIDEFYARPGSEPEPGDRSYVGPETAIQINLVAPELNITKTVDGCSDDFAFATIGSPTEWCLQVENVGAATAYNTTVTDELPYLWNYVAGSTAGTGWPVTEPSVTSGQTDVVRWEIGDLAPGQVAELRFDTVPSLGAPEVITNWAAAEMTDASGNSLPVAVTQARDRDPASATLGSFGLEIAKVPDRQEWPHIAIGGLFDWTIEIENPSTLTTNTEIVVVDHLPAPLAFSTWSSADPRVTLATAGSQGSGPGGTTPITWNITDLGPGETIVIDIEVSSSGSEVPQQWYVNDVQATSAEIGDEVVNQAKVRFYEGAGLGNFVWKDDNVDGLQDASEPGVDGVLVTLFDQNGDPLYRNPTTGVTYNAAQWAALSPAEQAASPQLQTTTGDDPSTTAVEQGWYWFGDLLAGTYQVEFDPSPVGLFLTFDEQGPNDTIDSDANRFLGLSHLVTLTPGSQDPTIDAGLIDPADYDATIATIDVEKFTNGVQADIAPGPGLIPGNPVTWTYLVTNTGWTALSTVEVVDDPEGAVNCDVDGDGTYDGTNVIPLLGPGESRWCTLSGWVGGTFGSGSGPYANTIDASGSPTVPDFATCGCDPDDPATWPRDPSAYSPASGSNGSALPPVNDEDPSHYFSASPAIDIEKTTNTAQADVAPGPAIAVGDAVNWNYSVANTGNTALLDITVTDDQGLAVDCGFGTNVIPLLVPGQRIDCRATGVATPGQYANIGLVTGAPALPDPMTCGCDLSDPSTWPDDASDYAPAVGVAGMPFVNVDDKDPSHYYGSTPSIDIEKDTNGVQADTSPGPAITPGDTVTWTYTITNTGNTALNNVNVTDNQGVTITCDLNSDGTFESGPAIGLLTPAQTITCEATGTAAAGQYANTGTVTGDPVLPNPANCECDPADPTTWPTDPTLFDPAVDDSGTPIDAVDDRDDSHYYGTTPSIDIEKDTNGVQADTSPGPAITPGDTVTWTYVVENTGNTALNNVNVTDNQGVTIICDLDGDGTFESNNTINFLLPNASVTCEATGTATAGQYANTGTVTGDPVLPNPANCECDPADPTTWPTDPTLFDPAEDDTGTTLPNVDDNDDSHYYGTTPSIDIEKDTNGIQADTSPGPAITPGDTVTWTYVVENTGNTALNNVTIIDDQAVAVDCATGLTPANVINVLVPGQSVTCVGSGLAVPGQYANVADVTGDPILPNPASCGCDPADPTTWPLDPDDYDSAVDASGTALSPETDTDPSHYFGAQPSIDVEKDTNGFQADNPTGPGITVDSAVTWTYLVINTGNTALDNVTISDSEGEAIACDIDGDGTFEAGSSVGLLLPGASLTCEASGTATPGQYANTASLAGDPVLPDAATCGCDLADPATWPSDPTFFSPTVDETGSALDTVEDDDDSHYYGTSGGIDIEKTTNTVQADTAPGPAITPGDAVTWTYTVTNTSTAAVVNSTVTDSEGVSIDCGNGTNIIDLLAPGQSTTCEGTGVATPGQYENSSLVVGNPALPSPSTCGCDLADAATWPPDATLYEPIVDDITGEAQGPVNDVDLSHYFGADPDLDIEKDTNGVQADVSPGPAITPGSPVTWTYVVENTGNTALGSVTVVDDQGAIVDCGSGSNVIPVLNPGAAVSCTATGTSTSGQYANRADVSGDPILPNSATCGCDPANPASWPTDPTLFNPGVDAAGDPLGSEIDNDTSHYFGATPGLDVEKSTNGNDADTVPGPAITPGDAVTWNYAVENTGNTALVSVTVNDNQGVVVDCSTGATPSNVIPLLLPGQTVDCQGTGTAVSGQYVNIADVTGQPVLPDPATCECDPADPTTWPSSPADYDPAVDETGATLPAEVDTDPSHYFGAQPAIDVEKDTNGFQADDPFGPGINIGGSVTWTYTAVNTGNTALTNVTLTDSEGVSIACDRDGDGTFESIDPIAFLAPGASVTCQGTGTAVAGQYANLATLGGDPILPNPATCGCDLSDPGSWPDDPALYVAPTDEDGTVLPSVADTDLSHYYGTTGGIDLEKDTNGLDADFTPGPAIAPGDPVTWTYVVTNTSSAAVVDATITDGQGVVIDCGLGTNVVALLLPGASASCKGTGSASAGQYENSALVTGDPALPILDTCVCDPADSSTWPTAPGLFEPIIDSVTGQPRPPVDDIDLSHYHGSAPGLALEKATNGVDADVSPGPAVNPGGLITWSYVVTNSGNTALADVALADDQGVVVDCGEGTNIIALLLPGASVSCAGTGSATAGQYQNVAEATGLPVLPNPTTCGCDSSNPATWPNDPALFAPAQDDEGVDLPAQIAGDPSHYFGADPGIEVEKSTNGVDSDQSPGSAIAPGTAVTWTFDVTNTGNTALANVVVNDSRGVVVDCGTGRNVIDLLLPGATLSCAGNGVADEGQYVNVGEASGTPVLPNPDTCTCDPTDPATWPTDPTDFGPALDETGAPLEDVSDDDPSHYHGSTGGLDLQKSTNGLDADIGPGPTTMPGDAITWVYEVTNTGNTTLANISVTDDQGVTVDCGDGTNEIPLLLPGAPHTCEGLGEAISGAYANVGGVAGDLVLPDPTTCGCDPADPATWPDDPSVYIPATDEGGEPLSPAKDTDPSHYFGAEPSVDVEKDTNGFQADQAPGPGIAVEGPVTWTYIVSNDGNTALSNVTVADDQGVVINCDLDQDAMFESSSAIGLLLPGASVGCVGNGTATTGQYTNAATVTGDVVLPDPQTCGCDVDDPGTWPTDESAFAPPTDASGEPVPAVTDIDRSHYFGTDGGLDIEKSTNDVQADAAPGPALDPGETVTWIYVVTNNALTAITDATVTDSQNVEVDCGDGTNVIALLLPGDRATCEASDVAVDGPYQNTGLVSGQPTLPDATTCGCNIGDPLTWPTDPSLFIPTIDEATGEPTSPSTDSDPSHYVGAAPGVDVEKATNGSDADDSPGPSVTPGDEVVWTFAVTNTGNTALSDVMVVDSEGESVDCGSGSNSIAVLLPGETRNCEASGIASAGQYRNVASVSGSPTMPDPQICGCDLTDPATWPTDPAMFTPLLDQEGSQLNPIVDEDPSHYFGVDGGLAIIKTTETIRVHDGEPGPLLTPGLPVRWTYLVTNNTTTAMTDLVVSDDDPAVSVTCQGADGSVSLLLPGESVLCEGSGIVTAGSYRNVGSVSGIPSVPNPDTCGCDPTDVASWPSDAALYRGITGVAGQSVTAIDDDPSGYVAAVPSIMLEKFTNGLDADLASNAIELTMGDEITWTYTVTNDGTTALRNVSVTDDQGVDVDCGIGSPSVDFLAPGESVTCSGTGTATERTYENIGTASGQPVLPDPATCDCAIDDPSSWPSDPTEYTAPIDPSTGSAFSPIEDWDASHYTSAPAPTSTPTPPTPTTTPTPPTLTPTSTSTSTPTPTPTPTPTTLPSTPPITPPTPTATLTPESTPVPIATATPDPTATTVATQTPESTPTTVPASTPPPTSIPASTAVQAPTATSTPGPTFTPVPTATPVPVGEIPRDLAFTGSNAATMLATALLAMMAGSVLLALARRRRTTPTDDLQNGY